MIDKLVSHRNLFPLAMWTLITPAALVAQQFVPDDQVHEHENVERSDRPVIQAEEARRRFEQHDERIEHDAKSDEAKDVERQIKNLRKKLQIIVRKTDEEGNEIDRKIRRRSRNLPTDKRVRVFAWQSDGHDGESEHVRQAIVHLHQAGWHEAANRLSQRLARSQKDKESNDHHPVAPYTHAPAGQPTMPYATPPEHPPEFGPWGQAAAQHANSLHQAIADLSRAVKHLEERTRNTDRIAAAADEAHRRVEELQGQLEHRSRELEERLGRELDGLESQAKERWEHMERFFRSMAEERDAMRHRVERFQREYEGRRRHVEEIRDRHHDNDDDDADGHDDDDEDDDDEDDDD